MQIAISGLKKEAETSKKLKQMMQDFREYVKFQRRENVKQASTTTSTEEKRWNVEETPRGPAYRGTNWFQDGKDDESTTFYMGEILLVFYM